jgi:hypothetical protein
MKALYLRSGPLMVGIEEGKATSPIHSVTYLMACTSLMGIRPRPDQDTCQKEPLPTSELISLRKPSGSLNSPLGAVPLSTLYAPELPADCAYAIDAGSGSKAYAVKKKRASSPNKMTYGNCALLLRCLPDVVRLLKA